MSNGKQPIEPTPEGMLAQRLYRHLRSLHDSFENLEWRLAALETVLEEAPEGGADPDDLQQIVPQIMLRWRAALRPVVRALGAGAVFSEDWQRVFGHWLPENKHHLLEGKPLGGGVPVETPPAVQILVKAAREAAQEQVKAPQQG